MAGTSGLNRRHFCRVAAATVAAGELGLFDLSGRVKAMADVMDIRPFRVKVPDADLTDLHRRVKATRWPDRETVADASQGVQLATMRALADHWVSKHDWRKTEARINSFPQFITQIDGLDIHFVHVRSKQDKALP